LSDIVRIYIGFDPVESVAYHTCVESIIRNSSKPVSITPLYLPHLSEYKETHQGSNQFIHSRFLVPYLEGYHGSAIFLDGDMIVRGDIAKLWEMRDPYFPVQCVKHDYKTKYPVKYLGASNIDYPRKNWSSVMIFNNQNVYNRKLTPEYVMETDGKTLHRFEWLPDERIGELPDSWNRLVLEQPVKESDQLLHWTIGTPCFKDYQGCDKSEEWYAYYAKAIYPMQAGKETAL
jgi:lipopolysaccharide biosynthesis glycosyltransferase